MMMTDLGIGRGHWTLSPSYLVTSHMIWQRIFSSGGNELNLSEIACYKLTKRISMFNIHSINSSHFAGHENKQANNALDSNVPEEKEDGRGN